MTSDVRRRLALSLPLRFLSLAVPTETIDRSTTRRAVRAVTLGVGALLSFRMRRQTTPASPGHHGPRGGGRSVLSVSPPSQLRPFVASIIAGVEGTRFGCVVCPAHLTTVPGHCLARARPSRPTAPVLVGQRRNVKAVLPATAAASAMWLTYGCLHSVRPRPRLFLRRPPPDFPPVLLDDGDVRPQPPQTRPRPRQGAFCRDFVT